jgi:hypothetical protein
MTDATDNGQVESEPDEPERHIDLDAIIPETASIVVGDITCFVRRLKTREMLGLLRILTHGLGLMMQPMLEAVDWDDQENVVGSLGGMFIAAMPEAPNETIAFLKMIVVPVPTGDSKEDLAARNIVTASLEDAELDVFFEVIELIVQQEAADLASLAGKVRAMGQKLGPLAKPRQSGKRGKPARGRARST